MIRMTLLKNEEDEEEEAEEEEGDEEEEKVVGSPSFYISCSKLNLGPIVRPRPSRHL